MIYVTHGVLEDRDPQRISHALMLSRLAFAKHLQTRPTKYVSIKEAAAGLGDALTVDDATRAGFEQVVMARRFGHAVTWFLNGENVDKASPYFPFLLSWMVDETSERDCFFDRQVWALDTLAQRKALRLRLKCMYMRFSSAEQVQQLIHELSDRLGLPDLGGDPELRTAHRWEVEEAARYGVELDNHGWSHLNPRALPLDQCLEEIARNDSWIGTIQPGECGVYAPPYGGCVSLPEEACSLMLLADRTRPSMHVGPRLLNRRHLPTELLEGWREGSEAQSMAGKRMTA